MGQIKIIKNNCANKSIKRITVIQLHFYVCVHIKPVLHDFYYKVAGVILNVTHADETLLVILKVAASDAA